ncbi:MAG: hypothetical protein JXR64_12450, partial [Spirochaetales bacterium]|nr:hypothetical protein [Spirochaetales bacterium]
ANNGKHSRFLGADQYINNSSLIRIEKIMDSFTNGISLWQDMFNEQSTELKTNKHKIALNKWKETLNLIKKAYLEEQIPTMEKYISRIVTINEFESYKTDKDLWFKKDEHEIQEPSEDWISYGYIEIEK